MLIERLLQNFRIVTKVVLFLVPLIALIAGVGLLGYITASNLNGHMTITRQTIDNLSDFEELRAALVQFTESRDEEARDELAVMIDQQQTDIARLNNMLVDPENKQIIASVYELGDQLKTSLDVLWTAQSQYVKSDAAIDVALDAIQDESKTSRKQIAVLSEAVERKQAFIRDLMFDASAYRIIAKRIGKVRKQTVGLTTPEDISAKLKRVLKRAKQDFNEASSIASADGKAEFANLFDLVGTMQAMAKKPAKATLSAFTPVERELAALEDKLNKLITEKLETAADRYVGVNTDIKEIKGLAVVVDNTFNALDQSRADIRVLREQLNEQARETVLLDLQSLDSMAGVLAEKAQQYAALATLQDKIAPSIASIKDESALLISAAQSWAGESVSAKTLVVNASATLKDFVSNTQETGKALSDQSASVSMIAMIAGTLLSLVGGFMLIETLRGPLNRVTDIMTRLARGDLDVSIDGQKRKDEIGDMVRSISIFRDNAVERIRLEHEAEEVRERETKTREEQAAERARIEAEQSEALDALAAMLNKIAEGNLEEAMREDLASDYATMAQTFNNAVTALRQTLSEVRHTSEEISAGTGNLAASADDLAKRTEQQAASLEESARALEKLTSIVKFSAENAQKTSAFVEDANAHAQRSGEVVTKAVSAMDQINESSEKINMIVGVIDEIAFQTNLLALNAGVEAARAGDAGKGFAVVAQEVRELAQRSGKAAQEIRTLITESANQVRSGVSLVQETGEALSVIHDHFASIRNLVTTISNSASEQSTGLTDLNSTVRGVEQITQANAAMVEENNAEIHGLRQKVELLNQRIDRFKVRELPGNGSGQKSAA